MAANNDCLPQIHACAVRVTNLDSNGVPHPGANSMYTTNAFTKITINPVYEDGTELSPKNACDSPAFSYKGPSYFKRADFDIELINQDPYLAAMLGAGTVITDGVVNGFAYPAIGVVDTNGVSIETWAKRIDAGDLHANYPYARWAIPKVKHLRIGSRDFSATEQKNIFTGQALENVNWFDGPLNDWTVASDRVAQWMPVAALPASVCGPVAVAAS